LCARIDHASLAQNRQEFWGSSDRSEGGVADTRQEYGQRETIGCCLSGSFRGCEKNGDRRAFDRLQQYLPSQRVGSDEAS